MGDKHYALAARASSEGNEHGGFSNNQLWYRTSPEAEWIKTGKTLKENESAPLQFNFEGLTITWRTVHVV